MPGGFFRRRKLLGMPGIIRYGSLLGPANLVLLLLPIPTWPKGEPIKAAGSHFRTKPCFSPLESWLVEFKKMNHFPVSKMEF
jgi:hypothetical protein